MALVYIRRQYRGNLLVQVIVITTASGPHANMDLAVQFEDIEICNRA